MERVSVGVEHIWVIVPYERRAYLADGHGFHGPQEGSTAATLAIAGTPTAVSLADVWKELEQEAEAQV